MTTNSIDEDFPALGFDPAPGRPAAIQSLARRYQGVADDLASADETLTDIIEKRGIWAGDASNEFARKTGELPEYLGPAARSMRKAADALSAWHTALTTMRERAAELESEAKRAAEAAGRANAAYETARAGPPVADPEAAEARARMLTEAEDAVRLALDACERIEAEARGLQREHDSEARDVADRLATARKIAPDEPNLAEKFAGGVETWVRGVDNTVRDLGDGAVDLVQDNANVLWNISDVVGDVGTAFGMVPATAPIGTALGLVAASGHVVAKAAGAEAPWATLAFDAVGAVPFGGLGTLLFAAQPGMEGVDDAVDREQDQVPTLVDDLRKYWAPKNLGQSALYFNHATLLWTPFWNAVDEGVEADGQWSREKDRLEDKVWS